MSTGCNLRPNTDVVEALKAIGFTFSDPYYVDGEELINATTPEGWYLAPGLPPLTTRVTPDNRPSDHVEICDRRHKPRVMLEWNYNTRCYDVTSIVPEAEICYDMPDHFDPLFVATVDTILAGALL